MRAVHLLEKERYTIKRRATLLTGDSTREEIKRVLASFNLFAFCVTVDRGAFLSLSYLPFLLLLFNS